MKFTAADIENKEFKKSMRGYNVEEVDEFLGELVDEFDELYNENSRLRDKTNSFEEKIIHYKKIEETIQNTLVLAQSAAEQTKLSAQKEADIIVKNANDSAQRMIDKANSDVLNIRKEYDKIRQEFEKFRSIYRNFMNSQIDMFERLEKDFDRGFNAAIPQGIFTSKNIEEEIEEEDKEIAALNKFSELEVAADKVDNATSSVEATKLYEVKNFNVNK